MTIWRRLFAERGVFTSFEAAAQAPQKVRALRLTDMDVMQYQGRFAQFTHLRKLSIHACSSVQLPDDIGTLKTLAFLQVLNMPIEEFPAWICTLDNLEHLTLRGTFIRTLPPDIARLSKLIFLSVSCSLVAELPPEIAELPRLRRLEVSDTRLTTLPESFDRMKSLRSICVVMMKDMTWPQYDVLRARFGKRLTPTIRR